ncbi:hypothetical protein ACLK12_21290 [Escherichia coli]
MWQSSVASSRGDKMAGRHGNKGVISEDLSGRGYAP